MKDLELEAAHAREEGFRTGFVLGVLSGIVATLVIAIAVF